MEKYGGTVNVQVATYSNDYPGTVLAETTIQSTIYDVYAIQSVWLGAALPGLQEITDRVRDDEDAAWLDILPATRKFIASYKGMTYMLPFDQDAMFVLFREDVREKLNLPVPETWEDVLAFAKAAHGTDLNDDGSPVYWRGLFEGAVRGVC